MVSNRPSLTSSSKLPLELSKTDKQGCANHACGVSDTESGSVAHCHLGVD